jgi:hypothetical protein
MTAEPEDFVDHKTYLAEQALALFDDNPSRENGVEAAWECYRVVQRAKEMGMPPMPTRLAQACRAFQ